MKFLILCLILFSTVTYAQEAPPGCSFLLENISEGKYQVRVNNYDSINSGESCYRMWICNSKEMPDGEIMVLDEKGNKRCVAYYKAGSRVGTHYEWYATGELFSKTNWETDLYFSSIYYFQSGKIKSTAANGNRSNAVYTSYYENGQVEAVYNSNSTFYKTYYENGQTKVSLENNAYEEWHSNGKRKIKGKLGEGGYKRIGEWKYYNEKGRLTRILFYEENNTDWSGAEEGYSREKIKNRK